MSRKSKLMLCAAGAILVAGAAFALVGQGHGDNSMGQRINAWLDDLQATGVRVLELPLFMLMGASASLIAIGVVLLEQFGLGGMRLRRAAPIAAAVLVLTGLAFVVDRRIAKLQMENDSLRAKMASARMTVMDSTDDPAPTPPAPAPQSAPIRPPLVPETAPTAKVNADPARPPVNITRPPTPATAPLPPVTAPAPAPATAPVASAPAQPKPPKRTTVMYDRDAAQKALAAVFTSPDVRPVIYDRATDLVQVKTGSPQTAAFLTIIDLTLPGVEIKVGGDLSKKSFTSDFALINGCTTAINGEAGMSPQANSGLGTWRGHLVSAGQALLKEVAGNPRPFLSFDKANHPTFTAQAASGRTVPADGFNVIWGRLDAIINGKVQTDPARNRQPRTAMGINKEGTRLYLMVVDGRQQRYSVGFTRAEVGQFLQAFGAYNGMLCDEGGSSCMYTRLWGIINSPSDGEERATYTHFGVVTPK